MHSKATAKGLRMSPRKVRRVVNEIRGKSAGEAQVMLRFMPFAAAREVERVLKAAMYNLVNSDKNPVSERDVHALTVVEAYADQGFTMKRWQPHQRGRAFPILKRTSHVTIVLSDV